MKQSSHRAFGLIIFLVVFVLSVPTLKAQVGEAEDDGEGMSTDTTTLQKADSLWGVRNGSRLTRMSLDECLEWALNYNPEVRAADDSIEQMMAKKQGAQRLGHPIIDYEYDLAPAPKDVGDAISSFFTGDITVFNRIRVAVGVPLYTFGKVKAGQRLADTGIQSEREKKLKQSSEVALNVRQLYYGIQLAREVRRLLDSAQNEVESEIGKREAKGGTDPSELLKLKLFQADLEKRIEEGEKREILAREALKVQLGLDRDVRFDIASSRLIPLTRKIDTFEKYRGMTDEDRSDLKLLDLGHKAKAQELKLEKRLMTPNVGFGAFFELGRAPFITGVTTTDDFSDPFNYTRAGFGFRLSGQFDYHQSFAKIRQLRSELTKIDTLREHARRGIDLELKEAYLELQDTRQELNRSEEAGKLSRQLLFLTQSNFDIGLAEPKDLIDAISSFLQTRGEYFEAAFNYNVAWGKLDNKVGVIPNEGGENHVH